MPARVVELVQHVGADPARAPFAVVRLVPGFPLDGHVVRMDLGANAVEQDPPFAADGVGPHPPREESRRQLLHDGAADLAADRLTTIRDLERHGQDRLGPCALVLRHGSAEQAREHDPPRSGVGRLAVHRRTGKDAHRWRGARKEVGGP